MFPRYACAINDGAQVVVTGGFGNRKDVLLYSETGFQGNLPFLNEGRQYHACARYTDPYGRNVKIFLLKLCSSDDDSYFRHCWWLEVSQGWRTQNPRRSSLSEPQLGPPWGLCQVQAVSLEQPIWTTLSTSLVNIYIVCYKGLDNLSLL